MTAHVADCPVPARRMTLRAAVACTLMLTGFGTQASNAAGMQNFTSSEGERPDYVQRLEENFGAPSRSGFGSTVLFAPEAKAATLEEVALAAYRHFTGKLWQEWGEAVWMGAWKLIFRRTDSRSIIAELRGLVDPPAKSSSELILDATANPAQGKAALSAAFDDAAVSELLVFGIGDSAAMSGLLIAARRTNGDVTVLMLLMD